MEQLFFLVCATLVLFACNEETTSRTVDQTEMRSAERNASPDRMNAEQTLDATIDAVETYGGDLTAIPGGAAVSTIDSWMRVLDGNEKADKVTGNLEVLREELASGDINGPLAGMLMITLAEDTRQVVGSNGNAATRALVNSLESAGNKLTADAVSGNSLLSQTLGAVKSKAGDITTLPAGAAVSNINSWIDRLATVPGGSGIRTELLNLRADLSADHIDGNRVALRLKSLAESTRAVADGDLGLETLAYALEAGYWRLKKSK